MNETTQRQNRPVGFVRLVLAALCGAVLLLASCGGSDDANAPKNVRLDPPNCAASAAPCK